MLSKRQNQTYQEFLALLEKLQNDCLSNNSEVDIVSLQQEFHKIQTFFQQHIAILTSQQFDEAIATRWQSIQTEIYREFRLLNTDMLFLASSRQAKTRAQRLKSLCARLNKIIGYCSAINSL